MDDKQFQDMQILLAHHERQIQDLSDIVTTQAGEIAALKARLERTNQKLLEVENSASDGGKETLSVTEQALRDKPPHY